MKLKQVLLLLGITVLSILVPQRVVAQIAPPGTYTSLPNNSSTQTTTLSTGQQWFKYTVDSTHTGFLVKLLQGGSQYHLSTVELFKPITGGQISIVFRDTLRADSTLRVAATKLSGTTTIYIRITSLLQTCGTCSGGAYPIVSLKAYALPANCSAYAHPVCQLVKDGGFEYSTLPCNLIPAINTGACANDPYVGFASCFWNMPLAANYVNCGSLGNLASLGTSDYYNSCSTPYTAHTGAGFSGAYLYSQTYSGSYTERNYREYITESLQTPLIPGNTYNVSLWVRRNPTNSFATANIQIAFSNGVYTQPSYNAIVSPAGQIINMASSPVTSTSWTLLSATFVAGAGYGQMTIGNFVAVGSSNVTNVDPSQTQIDYRNAYYFFDDVSIRPTNSNLHVTPQNSTICLGSTVTMTASTGSPSSFTYSPVNPDPSLTYLTPDHAQASVSPTASNTYYVDAVDQIGCITSTVANVTVIGQPTITINPANGVICKSGSASLTASGVSSYSWSTGSTSAGIVVSPSVTTVYTVIGDNHYCPYSVASATVYVYPTLTVSAAPNVTACPGANTALTATGGTGSYTWQPGGANTASIVVSPTVPTIYTVTSVASGSTCSQTATVLVNPIACCSVSTAVTFTATSGYIVGGTFKLNGPLTLTADLTLINVVIFMGTNAEILVPNNLRLALNTCHLLGCPQMWKGIRCTGAAAALEITKNTLIEDAITAVNVANVSAAQTNGNSYILFIEESTFNKNYTALNVENFNTASVEYPVYMVDNVFTSRKLITPEHLLANPSLSVTYNWPADNNTNKLKVFPTIPDNINPDTDLQTGYEFSVASYSTANLEIPLTGMTAHQGIYLNNVSNSSNLKGFRMQAYNSATYTPNNFKYHNVFDNLHYGVNSVNSNVIASHSVYQYMQQFVASTTGFPKPFKTYDGGVGINCVSTVASGFGSSQTFSVSVGPYVTGSNKTSNFFFNCAYGVKLGNIQYANVNYNFFHSKRTYVASNYQTFNAPIGIGEYGVYFKSTDYRGVSMTQNFMANENHGIIFIGDQSTFLVFHGKYVGPMNITANKLKANYGGTITNGQSMAQAIATDNVLSPGNLNFVNGSPVPVFVANNTIDKAFIGITAMNWNNQRVIDNSNLVTLVSDGVSTSNQYGIQHMNNLVDNMIGNTISGFGITKSKVYGILAAENKSQSMWCNSTEKTNIGVSFSGSQNLTSWRENKMNTHAKGMLLDNSTIGTQGTVSTPINNIWLGTWTGTNYKTYVNGLDPGTPAGNSRLYLSSLPTSAQNDGNPPIFKYKTTPPQSLFSASGSSGVSCPYSNMEGGTSPGTHGSFSGFVINLENIVRKNYAYDSYFDGNFKNGCFGVYRAILEDSSVLAGDPVLQTFKADADAGNIGSFFQVEQYLSDADVTSAQSLLTGIAPEDTVEQNMQRFYEIYIHTRTNAYSATDDADLKTLAGSCPEQMGLAVYMSRALLNGLYDVYYHYENDCGNRNSAALRMNRSGSDLEHLAMQSNFRVYPNPSTGAVYFSAANMGITSYKVTVYDIAGKAIFVKDYSEGVEVNKLELDLSNGVYLMQLTDSNTGDVYKQKFIIQK